MVASITASPEAGPAEADTWHFAPFSLDIPGRSLRDGAGRDVPLTPSEFNLLHCLVQRHGRVQTRDQLLQVVAGREAESFDRSIDVLVGRLRRKIEANPKEPHFIVTVAGAGYKFAVTPQRAGPASPAASPAAAEPPAAATLQVPQDRPSLAVLPFENMSGDAAQDYFADGVVEDIITALSRVGWFFVIARNSSFTYKGRAVDVKQVGRELGVRYLLEGSLRRAGNRVRITGQLIEAASGRHIWADRFDGDLADIFELQDLITESVVGAIEPNMRLAEIARANGKPTESLDAYDLYLRALASYYVITREGYEAALALLERAIAIDPGYAMAKAFMAFALVTRNAQGWSRPGDRERSIALARSALAASRDNPDILRCAGHAIGFWARDDDAALAAVDRAVRLNGNSAQVLSSAGWAHLYAGDPLPAIAHFRRALRLSPLDPEAPLMHSGLGWAHLMLDQDEQALAAAQAAVREMPNWVTGYRTLLFALVRLGRVEEARDAARRMLELDPDYRMSTNVRPYRHTKFVADYEAALRLMGLPE